MMTLKTNPNRTNRREETKLARGLEDSVVLFNYAVKCGNYEAQEIHQKNIEKYSSELQGIGNQVIPKVILTIYNQSNGVNL